MTWVTPRTYRWLMSAVGGALITGLWLAQPWRPALRTRLRHLRGDVGPDLPAAGSRGRIWIHASSVGEVNLALGLISAYRAALGPAARGIVLTTFTATGQRRARETAPADVVLLRMPLDTAAAMARALGAIQPSCVCLLETELWPNLVATAARRGIPVCLLNGRISVRSLPRYLAIPALVRPTLGSIRRFSMIHSTDAERIVRMGADPALVSVAGNAKYDALPARRAASEGRLPIVRRRYGVRPGEWVFVAGCTRKGEEGMVMDALLAMRAAIPRLRFIWVPRHPKYTARVTACLDRAGIPYVLRSQLADLPEEPPVLPAVVLVDTIGELFELYGIADAAFSGGSLIPRGGHNFLEIAVWGKPAIYGPSWEDFADAHELLFSREASIVVPDAAGLARAAIHLFQDPVPAARLADRVDAAIQEVGQASRRHVATLLALQ